MTAARKRVYMKHFCLLPHALSTLVSHASVQSGWRSSGLWPPSPRAIMSKWTFWDDLNATQQKFILDAVKLVAIQIFSGNIEDGVALQGTASDEYMEKLLEPLLGKVCRGVSNEVATNDISELVLNRWRWTHITRSVRGHLLNKMQVEFNEKNRLVEKRHAQEKKKNEKKLDKEAKAAFDETDEGKRIIRERADANEAKKLLKEAKVTALVEFGLPAMKKLKKGSLSPVRLQCSYCQNFRQQNNASTWSRCSNIDCHNCKVISCNQSSSCSIGMNQHIKS